MANEPEKEGDKEKNPAKRSVSIRFLIGATVALFLALFLHFREVRIDIPQIGVDASRYVVAEVDFEFPDEEATALVRQEALQGVGAIYKLRPEEISERIRTFKKELPHRNPPYSLDKLGRLATELEDILSESNFADGSTYDALNHIKVPIDNLYVAPVREGRSLTLPANFWRGVGDKLRESGSEAEVDYLLDNFKHGNWTIEKNLSAQKKVYDHISHVIPARLTKVPAGTRILRQGEEVTSRHIAMIKAMKEELSERQNLFNFETILGSLLFGILITAVSGWYFYVFHEDVIEKTEKLALYATIIVLTLVLSKVCEFLLLNASSSYVGEALLYPLFVPFAACLMAVLINRGVALFTTCFLSAILAVSLAVDHSRFLVINLITGIVVLLSSHGMRRRKEVFGVMGKAWAFAIVILIGFHLVDHTVLQYSSIVDFVSSFVFLFATSILIVGLLPMFESLFHIMTDMTLMEYMDPSSELLQRLSVEAPGTYQHSLVVGTLAEAGAKAIGANGLFCRVSTLYHDIGKLFNPHYFTENQMGGFNIHGLLTPIESAQVIVAHVIEGEQLARKYALPQSFIDIIREHHGTTLVYYFYCKQVELMGGDVDTVDEKPFRYPGPKPRTKESAIIMIADTIEAASRSLEDADEDSLRNLIDKLVNDKASEGQFDQCRLTFEELGKVKAAIVKTLSVTRHIRIKYPEKKTDPSSSTKPASS